MEDLTDLEKTFLDGLDRGLSKVDAMRASSYSGKGDNALVSSYAYRVLQRPRVKAELERRRENRGNLPEIITVQEVTSVLASILRGERYRGGDDEYKYPSAKDKIESAKALSVILGYKPPDRKEVKVTHDISEAMYSDVMEKSKKMLSRNRKDLARKESVEVKVIEE